MKSTKAVAARAAIAAMAGDVHDPLELLDEAARRIAAVVPHEGGGGWMLTDPRTIMPTAFVGYTADIELSREFFEHELFVPDVNTFGELHARRITVSTLQQATGGHPEVSTRYREIHMPNGLGDETRILFQTGGATWGVGCFTRVEDEPHFGADELAWLRAIAPEVGRGLRLALARRPPEPAPVWEPGMIVLDCEGRIEYTTGAADRWLAHLPTDVDMQMHPTVLGVAMQARAEAVMGGSAHDAPAQARVRADTGAWLYVHAAALRDAAGRPVRTAVMLEPADRAQLLPLLADVHGLTARERDVVDLLLSGVATEDVAARMRISRHTVRDHVKSVFAKVGVSSRAELTAAFA